MADTTERYYADLEHSRAFAEDEYFKARPQIFRTAALQSTFRAGFDRAFEILWQRFVDAEADALRLHKELVDLKYPSSADTSSERQP